MKKVDIITLHRVVNYGSVLQTYALQEKIKEELNKIDTKKVSTDLKIGERAELGISFAFQQPVKFKGITVYDLLKLASKKNVPFYWNILQ